MAARFKSGFYMARIENPFQDQGEFDQEYHNIVYRETVGLNRYEQWDPRVLTLVGEVNRLLGDDFPIFPFKPKVEDLLHATPLFLGSMQAAYALQLSRGDIFNSRFEDNRLKVMAAQSVLLHNELRTHIQRWIERDGKKSKIFMLFGPMGAGKTTAGAAIYDSCKSNPNIVFLAFVNKSELFRYSTNSSNDENNDFGFVGTASGFEFPAHVFKSSKEALKKIDDVIAEGKKPVVLIGEILFVFMQDGELDKQALGKFIEDLMERDAFVVLDVLNCFATSEQSPVAKAIITILQEKNYDVHTAYMFSMSSHAQTLASMVFPYKLNPETNLVEIHDPNIPVVGVIPTSKTEELTVENPYALFPSGARDWETMANGLAVPKKDALYMLNDLAQLGGLSLPLLNAIQPEFYEALVRYLGLPGLEEEINGVLRSPASLVLENMLYPEF